MAYQARNLDCCDCNLSFPFSSDQQRLCAELGYERPRRCPSCRRALEKSRRPVTAARALA